MNKKTGLREATKRFVNDTTGRKVFELESNPGVSNSFAEFMFEARKSRLNSAASMELLWRTNPDAQTIIDLIKSLIYKGGWEIEVNVDLVNKEKAELIKGFFDRNRKLLTEDFVDTNLGTGGFLLRVIGNGLDVYRSVLEIIPTKRISKGYKLNGEPAYIDLATNSNINDEDATGQLVREQLITYAPRPIELHLRQEDPLVSKKQLLASRPGDTFTGNLFYTRSNNLPGDFFGRAIFQPVVDRILGYSEMADSLGPTDKAARSMILIHKGLDSDQEAVEARLTSLTSQAKDSKGILKVQHVERDEELLPTPINNTKIQTRLNMDKALESIAQVYGIPTDLLSRLSLIHI